MQTEKTKCWFVEAYKPELNKLLQILLDDELETIIAIARKGPRLLEVIQKEWPKEGARLLKKVISNKAIPFSANCLCTKNNDTIIFDDILIYGSTYLDVANAVHEVSGDSPPGLILALDRESSKAELGLRNIPYIQRMETSEIAGFSAQIVEAFYYLGKPFDLEHPIIELPLKISREADIENFLSKSNLTFCNITSTFQRRIGVFYFTVDIPRSLWLACERIIDKSTIEIESVKVRLYFDFVNKIVRLMPLVLFSISSDEIVKGPSFNERFKFFDDLIKEGQKRTTGNQKQKEEAILSLINFLLAYMEGAYLLQSSALNCLFDNPNSLNPKINPFDLQILFGFDFGNYLHEKLNGNLKTAGLLFTGYLSPMNENSNSTQKQISRTYAENLLSEIKKELKIKKFRDEYPFADEPYSILKTIFSAMQAKDKREGRYTPDRLKFGFSFNDLLYIINKEFDYTCDPFRISAALDYYIDRGVVIPIFIKDDGRWFRVFRFGEANVDRVAFIIKNLLDTAASRLKKGIGSTDFEKILVVLHEVFKNKELGYEVYHDIRGKRPYYVSKHPNNIQTEKGSKTEPIVLTDWAVKEPIIKIDPAGRGYAKYVHLHPDFERYHFQEKNPWREERIKYEIDSVIDFSLDVLDLKLKNITKDELRLALSTCYNEVETLQAIVDELFGWFEEAAVERTNFGRIINEFKTYPSKLENGLWLERVDKNLGHVDEHLTQAFNKRETFKKLDLIKETLDTIYVRSNKDLPKALLATTYNRNIRPLFDSSYRNDAAWEDTNVLLDLCNTLTSLARTFLSEKNLIAGDKGRKISIEIERYNSAAKECPITVFKNDKVFRFKTINEEYCEKLLNSDLRSSFNDFVSLLDTLYGNLYEFYENIVENVKFYSDVEFSSEIPIPKLLEGTDIQEHVLKRVLKIAHEISSEGREGNSIGTAFIIGDSDNVLQKSIEHLKPNPYTNIRPEDKKITDESLKETIKEYAQFDGFFVIRGQGVIEAAGRFSTVDSSEVKLPEGLGGRHRAVAAITLETKSIGVLVSQSGGKIKIFKKGEIVATPGEITQIN